jgi:hypothetical protein
MKQKIRVRPSRAASVIALIVATGMLIFGIVFLVMILNTPEPGPGIAFLAVWFIALFCIIGYYIYNLTSRKGVALIEADAETLEAAQAGTDFETKLRKLEGLKKDGLVTEEEYRAKRAEIMGEKW